MLEKLDEAKGYVDGDMVIDTYSSYGDDGRLTLESIRQYALFEAEREYNKYMNEATLEVCGYTVKCNMAAINELGFLLEFMDYHGPDVTFGCVYLADGTIARDVSKETMKEVRIAMISKFNNTDYFYRCYVEEIRAAETKEDIMNIKFDLCGG